MDAKVMNGTLLTAGGFALAEAAWLVRTVTVNDPLAGPIVRLAGLKLHFVKKGRLPQEKPICPENPLVGTAVRVNVPELPAFIVIEGTLSALGPLPTRKAWIGAGVPVR